MEEFIEGDRLVIRAELPGSTPDRDVDVSVDSGILTIAAEREEKQSGRPPQRVPLWQFRSPSPTSGRQLTWGCVCRVQGRS